MAAVSTAVAVVVSTAVAVVVSTVEAVVSMAVAGAAATDKRMTEIFLKPANRNSEE